MCEISSISRSRYYNFKEDVKLQDPITQEVKDTFRDSKKTYGKRRIKALLQSKGLLESRRRIGRIMAKKGLVIVYTKAQYKVNTTEVNESSIVNELDRKFNDRNQLEAIVSDLTYVRVV